MQSSQNFDETSQMEKNKVLVLAFYESANSTLRADLLAPELVGRAPGMPPFDRDGFLAGIAELKDAFPDGVYTNEEIVAEGDKVVTVGRFRGTHLKPFHGMPPTGKPVTFVAVHVDRVANERIVEHLRVSTPDAAQPAGARRPASGAN